jgi:1-acyl-sn-glycerol-3-phosphate acyltransferase
MVTTSIGIVLDSISPAAAAVKPFVARRGSGCLEWAMPPGPTTTTSVAVEERVLQVVRALAEEVGGTRAAGAVEPEASLERDVGLGSLERVELLLRLEADFGRALDDRFLQVDTAAGLARLLMDGGTASTAPSRARAPVAEPAILLDESVATIHGSLQRRAERHPERPHVHMREDDGGEHTITYGRLWSEARRVAGGLRAHGVRRGDRVALMLPTGLDFLRSFQGVLAAGAVPVPIYPPVRLDRLDEYASRQSAILGDAGARLLVTIAAARAVGSLLRQRVPSLEATVTPDELAESAGPYADPGTAGGDPACIQYTSGSTGAPKGVLLTHDNLLANIRAIATALDARPTDVGVSWLPLYHDMGLIGSWLFCMHLGIPISILSPLAFLSRPERWLWTIHQRRATLSPAPNFAYELCARRIPEGALQGLDLSSWRCALNGAEPVSPDTLDRFARRFAPYGFRREALLPVYGLAEDSVALCIPPPGRGPLVMRVARAAFERDGRADPADEHDPAALRFVSSGGPLVGHEARIVDEQGERPDRTVGRLVFRGPSMMAGYYGQPEATAAITLPGGWLDSGDLAFRAEGEFYITGRRKDLIIKGGRNLVPQEIEEVAASVEGIRRGCVVAIGVERGELGTESLVIVAETRATAPAERERLARAVIDRVAGAVGVPPDAVELVEPGAVPKTSSGKIRRAETRELYRRGALGSRSHARRFRVLAELAWAELRARAARAPRALYAIYYGALLAVIAPPLWVVGALLQGRAARRVQRFASRLLLRLAGCRWSVEGAANLAGPGPYVLAINHASYADVPALLALVPRDFLFVAKREVLASWLLAPLVTRAGHLTVDRLDYQQGLADTAKVGSALGAGRTIVMFPEGTFTRAAGLRPFRLGAFKAAAEAEAPIVPVALRGTRRLLPDPALVPRPTRLHLWIGQPIAPAGNGWRELVRLRDRVADEIASHCGEPRLDLVAAGPERS